jgi:hypothetical protein
MASEVFIDQIQGILNSLNIPLKLKWTPNLDKPIHGEIKQNILFIYDEIESDAWETFIHEMFEYKLKKVSNVYRETVNALIEVIQQIAYTEKESFIESIPILVDTVKKAKSH